MKRTDARTDPHLDTEPIRCEECGGLIGAGAEHVELVRHEADGTTTSEHYCGDVCMRLIGWDDAEPFAA